ncbi:hypothetical protein CkaCkLH20_13302 [Colletotrichum karsti]|uniref:Uncharacterized protein n=1 Tax=Colletotrichum karsti TaxID=1095194 RepID=A0A9P6HS31_9PEZI|nr:uncharacterized protein CkaCkLH20_13302 [Colletotrichum karsti]KAF9869223.1 hypothetical protein CkaCkLH20_13302 [Colletotrichum karsti]
MASKSSRRISDNALGPLAACKPSGGSITGFQRLSPPTTPSRRTDDTYHSINFPQPNTVRAVSRLAKSHIRASKEIGVAELLQSSSLAAKPAGTRLYFRFQGRASPLPCRTFATSNSPDIAYLDTSIIKSARKNSLRGSDKTRWSKPTVALYHLRLASITPSEPYHDPYIASLLIAMAQEMHRANRSPNRCLLQPPRTYRVHVLLGNVDDKSTLHIFTTNVSENFLGKLDCTRTSPSGPAALAIQVQPISYAPYASFQQRLVHAMFPGGQKRARPVDDDGGT